jgi:hypothetical protein
VPYPQGLSVLLSRNILIDEKSYITLNHLTDTSEEGSCLDVLVISSDNSIMYLRFSLTIFIYKLARKRTKFFFILRWAWLCERY